MSRPGGGTASAAGVKLITGKQIKDGSIGLIDLSGSAKRALKGQRGPAGLPGPAGPVGAPGAAGATGAAGGFDPAKVSYVYGPTTTIAADAVTPMEASCPAGQKVLAGGYYASTGVPYQESNNGDSVWRVVIDNLENLYPGEGYAFATCAAR
jgi:hypothetical protein